MYGSMVLPHSGFLIDSRIYDIQMVVKYLYSYIPASLCLIQTRGVPDTMLHNRTITYLVLKIRLVI